MDFHLANDTNKSASHYILSAIKSSDGAKGVRMTRSEALSLLVTRMPPLFNGDWSGWMDRGNY